MGYWVIKVGFFIFLLIFHFLLQTWDGTEECESSEVFFSYLYYFALFYQIPFFCTQLQKKRERRTRLRAAQCLYFWTFSFWAKQNQATASSLLDASHNYLLYIVWLIYCPHCVSQTHPWCKHIIPITLKEQHPLTPEFKLAFGAWRLWPAQSSQRT